jgi:hypothetical protein
LCRNFIAIFISPFAVGGCSAPFYLLFFSLLLSIALSCCLSQDQCAAGVRLHLVKLSPLLPVVFQP